MDSTCSLPPLGSEEQRGDVWNLVMKVNYGGTLRRFSAYVHHQFMIIEYDMNKLRAKISSLFNFSPDAVLVLTYTDEDGDAVALDNDDELCDAVICQRLNPLRINVQLKSYSGPSAVKISDYNSDTGFDKASPAHNGFPQLATELNSAVEKSLKSVPEPIRGDLANIFYDVIQTASSTPMFSELLLILCKMQLKNVSQSSHESTSNPVGMSCGSPSLVNSNTDEEPKVSNDPRNQFPAVLPTNFVCPIQGNIQKMHEVGHWKQFLGSTYAPVNFDQNMSKEQKEGCEIHRDGNSVVAAGLPSMSYNIQCSNTTLGSFEKPKPNIAPLFLHGNSSTNMFSCDATARCPFDSMFSFKLQGGSTSHVDVIGNRPVTSPTTFPCNSSMLHPYKRSSNFHDSMPRTFHKGIICDGCGMHPIVGPRYKSTVFENYDLCSTCFRDMGSESEYTRIDWSAFHFPREMKDDRKLQYSSQLPSEFASHNRMKAPIPKLDSCFVRDVTVGDGTVMSPCSRFTKIWKMRNNGTISWPFGTQLVRVRGDYLRGHDSAKLEIPEIGFPVDEELDIAMDFVSPSVPGPYMSCWRMVSPFGQKFGEELWVIIQVDDHQSASSACRVRENPKSSQQNFKIIGDVDAEPLGFISAEPDANKLPVELLKPVAPDMFTSTQQEATSVLQSSSRPSSFMDSPFSFVEVMASSSPISDPFIDVSKSLPPVSYPLIGIPSFTNPSSDALAEEDPVEQTLLRELEEMGFKQIDLNKEILRQNQYDLEQSLEDLCGFLD